MDRKIYDALVTQRNILRRYAREAQFYNPETYWEIERAYQTAVEAVRQAEKAMKQTEEEKSDIN